MLQEALLLAVAATTLLYLFCTWTYSHWKKKGVPYVQPIPFFGNTLDLLLFRQTRREMINSFYEQGAGNPVIGFYQFREPTLLLRDPEIIKSVLVRDFSSFHDNSFVVNEKLDPLAAKNPFFLKGDKWKAVRSLLTPAFTAAKIKPMVPLMAAVCKDLVEYLEKEAPKGRPDGLETRELAAKFTTDVVATCAFGIAGNSLKDPNAELRNMGRDMMAAGLINHIKFTLITILPTLAKIVKVKFMNEEVSNFFRRMIKEAVTYREENKIFRNDYLDMLVQIKNKGRVDDDASSIIIGGVKMEYTDEEIAAYALTFFLDGFETSSVTLSFTLYELAVHPEVQDRLRAEVDSVLATYNNQLCHEALQEMVFMDMVINEALRLHPPGPVIDRICTKPVQFSLPNGATLALEKGSVVIIPIEGLHFDPQHFPDPEKFDPDRFSEDRKSDIKRYTYLPFGDGPRICLGMRFALTQMKAGLATIISNFEIRKTPKTPVPIVIDRTSLVPVAKGGLWIDYVKRTDVQ
ncbi:cytochrome P450 6k1 [Anabrus simplex]|uniref:cytochrome P450 6k1 n=1 Tax=Anabrus simplex TaxID=316456 RepID=UPI0035A30104